MQRHKRFGHCDFEIDPFACDLHGYLRTSVYEEEYPEGPQDAKTIIACDEDWYVKVEWKLRGGLLHHLCGYFCVCVYLESIGTGPDYDLDCDGNGHPCIERIPFDPCGDGKYEVTCKIPAGTIDCGDCGKLYLLAVTLTSLDTCDPPHPGHIAAYCKGPTLMFYEPPHPGSATNAEGAPGTTVVSATAVASTNAG
jgi:hypothetical protein